MLFLNNFINLLTHLPCRTKRNCIHYDTPMETGSEVLTILAKRERIASTGINIALNSSIRN